AETIDVTINDTDPDGNLDTASVNTACATCSASSNGSLINNNDGTLGYIPNPNFNGSDSFVYEICDTLGACDTASVSITIDPVADPPLANDDSASTSEYTPVTINVATNDTDPEGDLDPNSVVTFSSPGFGTTLDNGNGTITYTPDPGFTGSDSFDYQICDTGLLCDTATVNITVDSDQIIHVSSSSGGSVGGVDFKDEDILSFDTSTGVWSMFFDGSDVGLDANGQEINAFRIDVDGSVLLSLGTVGAIPDVGSVDDYDIVRFIPTSTGDTTAGSYELYFNGEDFGLDTASEDIDAIGFAPDG
ncbi:MAG: tandem-95 repeat protein, partial [Shimia sp.]|nr:tandem-95 repeat protein [Shimia sp.]